MVASHSKAVETIKKKKKLQEKPSQGSLKASKLVQKQGGTEFISHIGVKPILKGDVLATETNHVLSLPLTLPHEEWSL